MRGPSAPHIVFLGCGNMGGALLKAWLKKFSLKYRYTLITRAKDKITPFLAEPNVQWLASGAPLPVSPDSLIIAVKPSQIELALKPYAHFTNCLYMTLAAGKMTCFYRSLIKEQKFIRLMPNLPAAIGQGVTAAYTESPLSRPESEFIQDLIQAVGKIIWLEKEEHFHSFTALAGSGPAYVFLLVEALTQAALKQGLPLPLAEEIVRETVIGSAFYLKATSTQAETLREAVTSPGGTTQAALDILMNPAQENLRSLMEKAIAKAIERSQELAEA